MRHLKTTIFLFLLLIFPLKAQEYWSGEKYDIYLSLGTNIGGTSPIPVPETVTQIKNWRAGLNPSFEINSTFWHPEYTQWGLNSGLILEFKGMQAVAIVRNFPIELVQNKLRIQGIFRGENQTKVRNGYITVPLQLAYRTKGRFSFRLGGFFAYAGERSFKGIVSKGDLRKDLNSDKIIIEEESYDFSEHIRSIDAGLLMSSNMYLRNKMSLKLGFSWGFVPVFKSDFKGVAYNLYNIYLNTGLSYRW